MSFTAASACGSARTSIYSVRHGSSVSSRILNPSPCHRTGSKSGLCLIFIESIHEAKRLEGDIDHFFFGFNERLIAEAEFTAETFVGDRHDRRGAFAAH